MFLVLVSCTGWCMMVVYLWYIVGDGMLYRDCFTWFLFKGCCTWNVVQET